MADPGTVLVVDDDETIQQLLRVNFEMEGYAVEVVGDGQAAVETARRAEPDVILLDVMMPGIDGYDVCSQLKADPQLADVPVVFLSAMARQGDADRGNEVGADAYVTKPFDPIALIELVESLIGR